VTLRLENGKTVRKMAYKEWVNEKQKKLDVLAVGDVVVYISGMHFVQRISDDERKDNFCVVCGALRPSKEEKCYNCGHTLNFKPIRKEDDPNLWWERTEDFK
jgi:ribosomal protein L40E